MSAARTAKPPPAAASTPATYTSPKGRNIQEQIQEDAQNLCAAQCKDLAVLEKNLEKSGKYTKSEIEQAIKEIKEKNEIRGIKLW